MTIPIWQRLLSLVFYMLPWSDAFPLGSDLIIQFPILETLVIPSLPIILIQRGLPFGSILLFILIFFGIIRNDKIAYFLRFNALQSILINIILIILSYLIKIIIQPLGILFLYTTICNTIWIFVLTIILFLLNKNSSRRRG